MSKTTTKSSTSSLPSELLINIIKAIHSNIFRNEHLKIDKKEEWGNYAINLLTSSSLIYKISQKNFKYVKIYVMRDRQIICPKCENIMNYKNFKKHFLNVHQEDLYRKNKSYLLLEELRVMVGLYKFAEKQQILETAVKRFYFLEDCLKLDNTTSTSDSNRSLNDFRIRCSRETSDMLNKCKDAYLELGNTQVLEDKFIERKMVELEDAFFSERRNALLAEVYFLTDNLRRELLIEKNRYDDLLYDYFGIFGCERVLNNHLREMNGDRTFGTKGIF